MQSANYIADVHILDFLLDWLKMQKSDEYLGSGSEYGSQISYKNQSTVLHKEVTRLFLEIAVSANQQISNEERLISVKGLSFIMKRDVMINETIKMIQEILRIVQSNSYHVIIIYVLYKALKNLAAKRIIHMSNRFNDISVATLNQNSICKICFLYVSRNNEVLLTWTDKDLYQHVFRVINLWVEFKGTTSIDSYDFDELICFCYNSTHKLLKSATHSFLINNFGILEVVESLYPHFFDISKTQLPKIEKVSVELILLYTELFVLVNTKYAIISSKVSSYTFDTFELLKDVSDLIGENELWTLIYYAGGNEELSQLNIFLNKIYKSFSITSVKPIIDKIAANFCSKFLTNIVQAYEDDNKNAIINVLNASFTLVNNLKGITLLVEKTYDNSMSLKMNYRNTKKFVSVAANTTLLGLLYAARQEYGTSALPVLMIDNEIVDSFSMLEGAAVDIFRNIAVDERKISLKDKSKVVDLNYYHQKVLSTLANQRGFFTVIENLLRLEDCDICTKVDWMLNTLPPHKLHISYFQIHLSQQDQKFSKIMNYDNYNIFTHYVNILLSIVSWPNDKDCKKVISTIRTKRVNDIYGLIIDIRGDESELSHKIKSQISLLNLLFVVSGFNYKFKLRKEYVQFIFDCIFNILDVLNSTKFYKDDISDMISILVRALFMLNYVRAVSLDKILKSIEKASSDYVHIANTLITETCNTIDRYPVNALNYSELKLLFNQSKNTSSVNNFSIVYISIILKKYDDKRLVTENLQVKMISFVKTCLSYRKPSCSPSVVILNIKLISSVLRKYKQTTFSLSDDLLTWLDYYILRTDQSKESYSDYFYALADQQSLDTVIDLLTATLSRKDINTDQLYLLLQQFIRYQKYRGMSEHDWSIAQRMQVTDSNNIYRGLTNLGSTCYINTVLQQLLSINEFSEFVQHLQVTDAQSSLAKVR